jgi:hypothetical protein
VSAGTVGLKPRAARRIVMVEDEFGFFEWHGASSGLAGEKDDRQRYSYAGCLSMLTLGGFYRGHKADEAI